jgi:NAD(P)-dependent dehydrogenase (short-subunit alcohol dehydrogenase family)
MGRLSGKVVIVTGGASGIGRAMAEGVAAEQGVVVVADRDTAGGEVVAESLRESGAEARFEQVDVARPEESAALVETVVKAFGRLDGMLCNAGIGRRKPALELTEADWDEMLDINLRGAFFCAQAAARQMAGAGGGSIVFTSSQLADFPRRLMPHYIAAKAGLLGLTRCLALEWGELGIRVNAIQPGVIETPINRDRLQYPEEREKDLVKTSLGRLGRPADLAGAALYLLSDEAAYVTGSSVRVDGGWLGP